MHKTQIRLQQWRTSVHISGNTALDAQQGLNTMPQWHMAFLRFAYVSVNLEVKYEQISSLDSRPQHAVCAYIIFLDMNPMGTPIPSRLHLPSIHATIEGRFGAKTKVKYWAAESVCMRVISHFARPLNPWSASSSVHWGLRMSGGLSKSHYGDWTGRPLDSCGESVDGFTGTCIHVRFCTACILKYSINTIAAPWCWM